MEKINYGGWSNCIRLSNGKIELIVTTDVGPRIIRFGFINGQNIFKEYKEQLGKTGGNVWRIYFAMSGVYCRGMIHHTQLFEFDNKFSKSPVH